MRIGVIRRSHDFHQQQRRRASSAVNTLDYTGSPRSSLSNNAINRRASAAVTEGGGGLIDDNNLFGGGGAGGRAVSLGGCSSRVRHDGHQFGRSSSQDSNGAGSGQDSDGCPSPLAAVTPVTHRGESMDLETDDLCYGKVLSVLGIIFGVLLLTLAFASAVRYIYR